MYIYLVTCLVNNKRYVGRTIRSDPRRRWREHCSAAKRGIDSGIIPRAIRKYGKEAFTFEVIEKVEKVEDLPARESYWITYYNTLSPNGYNLETYQPNVILADESRIKRSKINQGVKKKKVVTSVYVGVHKLEKGWGMLLSYRGANYSMRFKTEVEAAKAYDKMAIYLYGEDARLNFNREDYTDLDIKLNYDRYLLNRKHSSLYDGVHYSASINRWKGVIRVGDSTKVRAAHSEIEAAQFVDLIKVMYLNAKKEDLSFPDKYEKYKTLDENWLKKKTGISLTKGITKSKNRYLVRLGNGGALWSKSFKTKEEAEIALEAKRKELGMIWDI